MSLGWPYKCRSSNNNGVYGESNVPSCYRSSTFEEAVAICGAYDGESFLCTAMYRHGYDQFFEHHCMKYTSLIIIPLLHSLSLSHTQHTGGRLCTGAEILDRCTAGTGCSLNKALVWACSANSASCTASAECCSGLCNGGVCEDVNGPDTSSPSTSPTKGPTDVVSFMIASSTSLNFLECVNSCLFLYLSSSSQPTSSPSLKPSNSPSTSVSTLKII